MEKKNITKIVIVALAIVLVVAVIGGATFAYWQWQTATGQQTLVNVTVAEGIAMTIQPENVTMVNDPTEGTGMRPTNDCTKTDRVLTGTALVTIKNDTGIVARPKFMLKVKITKADGTDITNAYRQYIHYAVGETTGSNYLVCTSPIVTGTFGGSGTAGGPSGQTTDISNQTTGWYNSPLITLIDADTSFPKLTATGVQSVSFAAAANTTTTHTYRVWAWLGSEYTATNTGDTVTDPLQDATIQVSWSENSEVIQVTG